MGKGKKNKNHPRRDANLAAKAPITDTTDASGDTAAPVSGESSTSSTPTTKATGKPKNKTAASKVPNCHFVPRWILKNFALQGGSRRSNDPEIHCFDLDKKNLTRPFVSQAYAKEGLFKDPDSAPGSATYKLETELSQLEGKASRSFQEIRDALNNRGKNSSAGAIPPPLCIKQKRKYLQNLRKFMFVMYYHQLSVGETYYNETHPDNANLQEWIKDYCEKYGLSTSPEDMHIWLHVLQHYLRKGHDDLMEEGRKAEAKTMETIFDKLGPGSFSKNLIRDFQATAKATKVDPKLEEWKSLPYYNNMQMFLVIWEAAPGEEFLMSDNSFGLYEGRTDEAGPLHWIYVISPRIVLVLCHPGLRDTRRLPGFIDLLNPFQLSEKHRSMSMLLNAPHPAAIVKYKNKPLSSENTIFLYGNAGAAPAHPDDEFEIQISVLSPEDTHTINAIILGNVREKGLVTFHSKEAALRTLDEFAKNRAFDHKLKPKFAPLAEGLSEDPHVRPNVHFNLQPFEPETTIPPFRLPPLSTEPGTFWETSLMVYHTLHRGHNPQCISYRLWEKMHTEMIKKTVDTYLELRPARLVSKLDDNVAYILFKFCTILIPTLFDGSLTLEVYLEQLIIGFLDNLLKNNRPFFDMIEERVIRCLREGHHQPELARTARIKEFLSPEDDEDVPVPVGLSFHDSEAAANRTDIPPNPDMAYMDWAFARTDYIRGTRIPSELDLPSSPSPTKPEQGEGSSDPDEKQFMDFFAKMKKADLEQEIRDLVPSHPCVTADDSLGREEVTPEASQDLHAEVSQGIHPNGGRSRGVSHELNSSFSPDVSVKTKAKQTLEHETLMKGVDPVIRGNTEVSQEVEWGASGRARRDLGGIALMLVLWAVVIALAPVVYSACICGEVVSQVWEILFLHYQPFIVPKRAQTPEFGGFVRQEYIHGLGYAFTVTVGCISIVCDAFYRYSSLTFVDFCTSLALNTLNNVDGQCTRILCWWVSLAN